MHADNEWKKSNVTPVHKKDSRENVSNYRPMSLLSIISKVMERCIHNRVYPILSALINKTQHGFLKKRSCVRPITVCITRYWKKPRQRTNK